MTAHTGDDSTRENRDFIREVMAADLEAGRVDGIVTRFPPEPNGFLHIGHAKSICLNFGAAQEFGGRCHLRFDDTNPETEDIQYVESIQQDIRWLGFDWGEHLYFASDYFQQLYDLAVRLIRAGKAYVDDLTEQEIREYRGTVKEAGRPSPYRDRSINENLDLLERMRAGEFPDGAKVLRAKIDMAHPNMKMRDPLMYRIRHAEHYRTGDQWCIYPFYDWAHGQSDAIEGISHSVCTLEFENNRELYDWFVDALFFEPRPHQYEFARLNLEYTIMSKRKLLQLVKEGYVSGWDDPRMPTIAGLRRRGYTAQALRDFADVIGVARINSRVEFKLLEHCIRADLNFQAPRVMCVLRPLKVVITNYPDGQTEELSAAYWPHDVPKEGERPVPFARELYIEQDDFMEEPPRGYRRLSPGAEVRLRYAYVIKCNEVIKDPATGEVVELRCTYDPATKGGAVSGRKVGGTIHWVAAEASVPVEVRLYDRLFALPNPDDVPEGSTFLDALNPDSIEVLTGARAERSLAGTEAGARCQFERQGYFVTDTVDSRPDALVFNRIVSLRDSWSDDKASQPATNSGSASPDAGAQELGAEEPVVGTIAPERTAARAANPKLAVRFERYQSEMGLNEADADLLTADGATADYFDNALKAYDNPKLVANWLIHNLLPAIKERTLADIPVSSQQFGRLVQLIGDGVISGNIGATVLGEMLSTGAEPDAIVEQRGLRQVSDADSLLPAIDQVLAANQAKADAYRGGKHGLFGFFMGQVMQATGGKANPQLVKELLTARLEE